MPGRQRPRSAVGGGGGGRAGEVATVAAVAVIRVAGRAAGSRRRHHRRRRRRQELAEAGGGDGGWMGEQGGLWRQRDRRPVRSLHAPSPPVVALLEHVLELDGRVEGPVVALALTAALARHLQQRCQESVQKNTA